VARIHFEHLIVFRNTKGDQQIWQLAMRRAHQPITYHEAIWHAGTDPEHLFQKLSSLFIPLEEEKGITLVDVKEKVTAQFEKNTKEVTKKFYREFSAQHKDFLKFIKGIKEKVDQEWYASLMLNRLMFIYFIQKKGFLDGERDYLQKKLKESKKKRGDDKFYTFYRDFLLVLFHQGLGSPDRGKKLLAEIGKVPYLNGGLFDVHDLEKDHPIEIGDKAFESLFAFFDTWNWHLDTRASSTGRDVNPDVIGYIFEQYINERAKMGAYYTKEDITAYIGQNTIIPWLFDEAKRTCAHAFKPEGGVWKLLSDDPDKYIYPSVKHGIQTGGIYPAPTVALPWWKDPVFNDLPKDVRAGLDPEQKDLWKIRKAWNVKAPEAVALPTEIYREVIERRRRYLDVRHKLVAGEVTAINDLITYNLDIQQFAQDVLHEYEGSDLVGAFYDAIKSITVLDPTCGSGAFLFAALGILEPLYEECLNRMQWFVDVDNEKGTGKKLTKFREELERMKLHPNSGYFIYKSIILQNLYGVDIMREAVEIAKLRLFLKLVSTVDPDPKQENYGIEPLPDIDFNIRSGNTLVGFATKAEVKGITAWSLDFDTKEQDAIEEKCEVVDKAFERYKNIQLNEGEDYQSFRKAKDELHKRLGALRDELDVYLAKSYSITDLPKQQKQFDAWKASHTPFHWFAEYYGIVHQRGGFDVIIGNPPYVEYAKVKTTYTIKNYSTLDASNLYAFVTEQSLKLLTDKSAISLIVPISLTCTQRMRTVQDCISNRFKNTWYSSYAERPSKLFEGAEVLLNIMIANSPSNKNGHLYSTGFIKWSSIERDTLFERVSYTELDGKYRPYVIPKLSSPIESDVFRKLEGQGESLSSVLSSPTEHKLFYRIGGGRYWKIFTDHQPYFALNGVQSVSSREENLFFRNREARDVAIVGLSSSLFYWYFIQTTNCRDLNPSDLQLFPLSGKSLEKELQTELSIIAAELMEDYKRNSLRKEKTSARTGRITYEEYYPRLSKSFLDRVDVVLAKYVGLTEEELDHVINYDIKYRMGDELEGGEDSDGGGEDKRDKKAAKAAEPKAPKPKTNKPKPKELDPFA